MKIHRNRTSTDNYTPVQVCKKKNEKKTCKTILVLTNIFLYEKCKKKFLFLSPLRHNYAVNTHLNRLCMSRSSQYGGHNIYSIHSHVLPQKLYIWIMIENNPLDDSLH